MSRLLCFALLLFLAVGCEKKDHKEMDISSVKILRADLDKLQPSTSTPSTEKMALVEKGFFRMGSSKGELNNQPEHEVNLDAFHIDRYETTYGEYFEFLAKSGWREHRLQKTGIQPEMPVAWITWFDAAAYCKWVGKRLPTEAEWEKAARGGTEVLDYPWGNELDPTKANLKPELILKGGSYPPNAFGLYDMIGNVWEYVSDWYDDYTYLQSEIKNPQGPKDGRYKVIRGGSWDSAGRTATVFDRSRIARYGEGSDIGFRCALSAPQQE